jgi:hypothetical protein
LFVVDRFDLGESVFPPGDGSLEELDSPWQVVPTTVVLKNDRCSVFTPSVRLEGEALVHGALSMLERDVRKILKHPVGLKARDVLVEKKVALSLLPFLYVKGFGYGHAVHADEPQLSDIIVDV